MKYTREYAMRYLSKEMAEDMNWDDRLLPPPKEGDIVEIQEDVDGVFDNNFDMPSMIVLAGDGYKTFVPLVDAESLERVYK